jgi:GTP cyclohydrolase I
MDGLLYRVKTIVRNLRSSDEIVVVDTDGYCVTITGFNKINQKRVGVGITGRMEVSDKVIEFFNELRK